jgi:hypothetical protein
MTQTTTQNTSAAWHAHWNNTGVAAIDLFENNPVSNTLQAFWNRVFQDHREASTLDIGAGAGALAALALKSKVQVGRWICLDSAASASTHWPKQKSDVYNPQWSIGSIEKVVPTVKVDLIVSNFGAEYADLSQVATCVRAWSHETTRIAWVLHARDSIIDQQSQLSLADLNYLLSKTRFFSTTQNLISKAADVPTDPLERMMHGVQERDAFNLEVNGLKAYMAQQQRRSSVLIQCLQIATATVEQLVQRKGNIVEAVQRFEGFVRALQFEKERLEQMNSVALDGTQVETLTKSLAHHGFRNLRVQQLHMQPSQSPQEQLPVQSAKQATPTLIAWVVNG